MSSTDSQGITTPPGPQWVKVWQPSCPAQCPLTPCLSANKMGPSLGTRLAVAVVSRHVDGIAQSI